MHTRLVHTVLFASMDHLFVTLGHLFWALFRAAQSRHGWTIEIHIYQHQNQMMGNIDGPKCDEQVSHRSELCGMLILCTIASQGTI